MKILKIKILNLASIPEAVIDFTKKPLSESPLFLICGDTGAGKSTITDAICLAFYGKTPRFVDVQKDEFDNKDSLNTVDVRNIMRKGTAESLSSVDFVGDDNLRYRAEWSLARSHKKIDGKLQSVKRTLFRIINDDVQEPITEKINEFDDKIVELTGLDFNRFIRSVLLAQNQFSKFLFANKDVKSEILQMLTNTDIYEKISKRIFDKFTQEKNQLAFLTQQIEGKQIVKAEDIEKEKEELRQLKEKSKLSDKNLTVLNAKIDWKRQFAKFSQQLQSKQKALLEAKNKVDSLQATRKKLSELEIANKELRPINNEIVKTKNNLANIKAQLLKVKDRFSMLLMLFSDLNNARQRNTEELSEKMIQFETLKPLSAVYEQVAMIDELIESLVNADRQILQFDKSLQKINGEISDLTSNFESDKQRLTKAEKEFSDSDNLFQVAEKQCNEFDKEALKIKNETCAETQRLLSQAKIFVENRNKSQSELNNLKSQLEMSKKIVENYNAELEKLSQKLKELEIAYNAQREIVDKQKLEVSSNLKKMRAQLVDNEPCPLCGSLNHPYAQQLESVFDNILATNKKLLDDKKIEIDNVRNEVGKINGELNVRKSEVADLETVKIPKLQDDTEKQIIRCKGIVDYYCKQMKTDYSLMTEEEMFKDIDKKIFEQKAEIQKLETLQTQLQNALETSRKSREKCRKTLEIVKTNFLKDEKDLEMKKLQHETTRQNKQNQEQSRELFKVKLVAYISDIEDVATDIDRLLEYKTKIDNDAKKYQVLKSKIDDLNKIKNNLSSISDSCTNVDNLSTIFEDAVAKPYEKGDTFEKLPTLLTSVLEKSNIFSQQISDNENILMELSKSLKNNIEKVAAEHPDFDFSSQAVEKLLATELSKIKEYTEILSQSDKIYNDAQQSLKDAQINYNQHIESNINKVSEQETEELLSQQYRELKTETDTMKTKIGTLQSQIQQQETEIKQFGELLQKRDAQRKIYDEWESLNKHLGSTDGKKLRNLAQIHTLKILLHNADQRLMRLTDKYRLRCGGDSLAILVEDCEMGVVRPVTTLSGGESFMVSLALALGLSDMMQGGKGSEMLFIDEGFGTLDQQTLNSVISMLEKLHSQGRKVGIISHVPELEERIDAKIMVKKCDGDNTRSDVKVVEY